MKRALMILVLLAACGDGGESTDAAPRMIRLARSLGATATNAEIERIADAYKCLDDDDVTSYALAISLDEAPDGQTPVQTFKLATFLTVAKCPGRIGALAERSAEIGAFGLSEDDALALLEEMDVRAEG